MNTTLAQNNEKSLIIQSKFDFLEFTETRGNLQNNNSISLSLPSTDWNLTNIELNFTNIKQDRAIKTIEDNATAFETLKTTVQALGVQIVISEPTIVFGIYIFGAVTSDVSTDSIYVQINGYDSGEDEPNDTVFGSTSLNISRTLGWHLQTFDEGISLSPGNYYLVLNGIGYHDFGNLNLYWFFNDQSPIFPNLYVASYYWGFFGGWTWRDATQGQPYLYKLVQRTNKTYFPENINMTAELGSTSYPILNGTEIGSGHLELNALNFSPIEENLYISIKNNESVKLFFNLSYSIGIAKEFYSAGSASIKENSPINWTLAPEISRLYLNYSIKFKYPNNWYNLNVFRDGQNITSQVLIDSSSKYIHVPNSTIIHGAEWIFTANSPNIDSSLDVPITEYGPDEILYFYVNPPIRLGNYSIILADSKGNEVHRIDIEIDQENASRIEFMHTLPSEPNEGTYKAYIFWNNATNAGLTTQTFTITLPFILDPFLVIFIAAIVVVAGIGTFSSYKAIKRSRRIHEEHRQSIFNKYMDILNLDYFLIVEKNSGVNIFDQVVAGRDMNPTLVSGFLQAIQSFGIDLTGSNEQSQMVKLEYQNSKILMSEFKNYRLTLIMKENPSKDFLNSIELLSYDIDEVFGEQLEKFDGEISQFEGIKELIEKRLPIPLIYPLKIKEKFGIKLKPEENHIITRAQKVMKMKNSNYFFVSNLISQEKGFQVKEAELILKLIEKDIFQPIQ